MNYFDFENAVLQNVPPSHFHEYRHLLHSVPYVFRQRYIDTLRAGVPMADALKNINNASKLPDKNYFRYLNYLLSKKKVLMSVY